MNNKPLAASCLLVVAGILVAALWPFIPHPRNEVAWTSDGLWFGDYGSILSSTDAVRTASPDGNCSLEIWLTPGLTDDFNVILAYALRENPQQFTLGQNGDAFYVMRNGYLSKAPYIQINHVFRKGMPVLLTLTQGNGRTQVYLNGKLAKTRRDFGLSADNLAGRLVVANSPVGNNSWSGLLQGIAVYGSELSAEQVAAHYEGWSAGNRSTLVTFGSDVLYLFREGTGKVVHNLGRSRNQPDLYIPDHYMILYPSFLRPFWKESFRTVAAIDISNNILAFIPLGFLLTAWFSAFCSRGHSVWSAILLGSLLSLFIEILQYFIPMRVSDSMDWLMNTAGTVIGAWLYVLQARYDWLGKLPMAGRVWKVLYPSNPRVTGSVGSKLTA